MATKYSVEKTANPEIPAFNMGDTVKKVYGSYAKTASLPADGDYVIMAENVPVSAVIHKINLTHPAISGMTDVDIILLDESGSVVEDSGEAVEYLAETLSFATARANANVLAAAQKPLKELLNLGGDVLAPSFDIAMRVVTGGSTADKTIKWDIEYSTPAA